MIGEPHYLFPNNFSTPIHTQILTTIRGEVIGIKLISGIMDYKKMKREMQPFAEELIKRVFLPSRVIKIADSFNLNLIDYLEQL
jgi:hypothetical protein